MCLIIQKPAGLTVERDIIASALERNPDGFGIMASNGKTLRAVGATLADCVKAIASVTDTDAAIHWRMATQGSVTRDNAHPFRAHGHYLMHNGHLNGFNCKNDGASDTRLFVERWLAPRVSGGKAIAITEIEKAIGTGNAVAIMRPDKKIEIANRWRGTDHNGLWFSNLYAWDAPRELLASKYPAKRATWWESALEIGDAADQFEFSASNVATIRGDSVRAEVIDAITDALPTNFGPSDVEYLEPLRGSPARDFATFRDFSASRIGLWEYLEKISARSLVTILRDLI